MANGLLDEALCYRTKLDFSVIPATKDKKPLLKWEEFQSRKATENEIREWWKKWPDANVGIVTGTISNLAVVDIDTEEGRQAIKQYIPDDLQTPRANTPKGGQHIYFRCPDDKLSNNARVIPGCDLRANGGYVIAPPSQNGTGKTTKGKSKRWIPLSDRAFELALKRIPGKHPEAFLFVNSKTGRVYRPKTLNNVWKTFSGLQTVHYEASRHSFCTQIVESGADVLQARELMRHANIRSTQKYFHGSVKRLRDIVNQRGKMVSFRNPSGKAQEG